MGGHHSKPAPCVQDGTFLTIGCSRPPKRSLPTGEHDLDAKVLLRTETVFYALAIVMLLLAIGHQVLKFRAKKRQTAMTQTANVERFADEDVEKGRFGNMTSSTH